MKIKNLARNFGKLGVKPEWANRNFWKFLFKIL